MRKSAAAISWFICIFVTACCPAASTATDAVMDSIELARSGKDFSSACLEPVYMASKPGLAVTFEGTDDLHFYASPDTTAASGFELKVRAKSDILAFAEPVFPKWRFFQDPTGKKIEVYAGNFIVFIPFDYESMRAIELKKADIEVKISGIACTSIVCLAPFEKTLQTTIDFGLANSWRRLDSFESVIEGSQVITPSYSVSFALLLAFLAGLSLNIMPCVWPVLPIIVMRIIKQAQQSKARAISLGLTFCLGILLFFACLAVANIILQIFYHTALSWGDHLRNPTIVTFLSLLIIVMALFMFGVFTITLPSSIASKSGTGDGFWGSIGMGFLAAILSTPCSFGILTVAFIWIQGQSLPLGTLAIIIMGIGMALPYAILTSMPGLLKRLPKAGRWMELFKQTLGFVLLLIAVKLLKAIPSEQLINVLFFAVVLSFCIWMWFGWVGYSTKLSRKLLVRIIALALAVLSFRVFFAPELIDWQDYNETVIKNALAEQRPVLIKFTAGWCTNCEVIDRIVYKRKDIAKLIEQKNVLPVKADTTENSFPATIALKNIYNEPGVPVSILFVPGKKEPLRWRGILFADELKQSLQQITSDKADVKKTED